MISGWFKIKESDVYIFSVYLFICSCFMKISRNDLVITDSTSKRTNWQLDEKFSAIFEY